MKMKTGNMKLSIPLTHMADIAYLLLIFIIIYSLISTAYRAPASLPASTTGSDVSKESHRLYIDEGGVSLNGRTCENKSLFLAELAALDRRLPVTVIAEKNVPFGKIRAVLKALNEKEYKNIEFLVSK